MTTTKEHSRSNVLRTTVVPVLLLLCLLYGSLVNRQWQPEWDSALYIELSRSMVSGQGFSYLGHPETRFLPGFPLALSPILLLLGKHYLLMNILMIMCAAASIWLTYRLFLEFFSREYSALIAIMTSLSWFVVIQSTYIMTDVPYMALSLASLLLINRQLANEKRTWRFLFLPLTILIACFVRTVGLSLFMTFVALSLLVRKELPLYFKNTSLLFKVGLTWLIVLAPVALWQVRNSRLAMAKDSPLAVLEEFTDYGELMMRSMPYEPDSPRVNARLLLVRAVKNVSYYAAQADCIVLGQRIDTSLDTLRTRPKLVLACLGVLSVIITAGFIGQCVRERRVFDIYVVCYFSF